MTTPRQQLADAVRPFGPGGKLLAEHIPAFDAFADALDLPRDDEARPKLGKLSEQFESGGRGPGTVSTGYGDPGGVSYGLYQLASKVGTLGAFMQREGDPWRAELNRGGKPGTRGFSNAWRAIAKREPDKFADAQHAFIERTHYEPTVSGVRARTGLDLDSRTQAVRDTTWSVGVQHGGAVRIIADAVALADDRLDRNDPRYDEALIRAIYERRSDYVRSVAERYKGTTRNSLLSVVQNRYPAELRAALAMLKGKGNA